MYICMFQEQQYVEQAHAAWEQAWGILHETEGWNTESGHDAHKGCVCSRKFHKLGKIFKLEVITYITLYFKCKKKLVTVSEKYDITQIAHLGWATSGPPTTPEACFLGISDNISFQNYMNLFSGHTAMYTCSQSLQNRAVRQIQLKLV